MRPDPSLETLVDELRAREAAAREQDRILLLGERRETRARIREEVDAVVGAAAEKRRAFEESWLSRQRIQELGRAQESRLRAEAEAAGAPGRSVGGRARAEAERLQRDLSPTQRTR